LIGAADWPRTNRAVHRLILGSRLVEKIAYVTVSIALGDSPESAIQRIQGEGDLVSSLPKRMTGALHVSKTADRTDLCARRTVGLWRLGTGRAALPGAAGRHGHRRAGGRRSGGYGRYSHDTGRAALPGAAGRHGRRRAGAPGAPAGTADTATTLASTGAGFNVGATVLIAVTVLLLGVGLVLLGRHLRRSNTD
jgi:hypothetical protein